MRRLTGCHWLALAEPVRERLLMNNCYRDSPVRNAARLCRLLSARRG